MDEKIIDERIILALLTPRGGEKNHLYVVPTGSGYSDRVLTDRHGLLERIPSEGIRLWAKESQWGGRVGTEVLFLHFDRFATLPEEKQDKCSQLMADWFNNDRERMIQSIDWSKKENQWSVVFRAELDQLYWELYSVLSPHLESGSRTPTSQTPKTCTYFTRKKVIIMNCLLVLVALASWLSWLSWLNGSPPANSGGSSSEKTQNTRDSGKGDAKPQDLTPYYRLFDWPDKEPLNENNLKKAFNDVWRVCGEDTRESLENYRDDKDVKTLVTAGNTGHKQQSPLILGTLSDDADNTRYKRLLEGISPQQLRKILLAANQLQKSVELLPENRIRAFLKEKRCPLPDKYDTITIVPQFFCCRKNYNDLDLTEWLRNFLVNIDLARNAEQCQNMSLHKILLDIKDKKEHYTETYGENCDKSMQEKVKKFFDVCAEDEPLSASERGRTSQGSAMPGAGTNPQPVTPPKNGPSNTNSKQTTTTPKR
ncbi:MAG: hypothetical protein ACRC10_06625 [Thermoguttaceae bacterium]